MTIVSIESALAAALLLASCTGVGEPGVEASPLADTRDTAGPYLVLARAWDDRGVDRVELVWRLAGAPGFVRERLTRAGDDLWRGAIAGSAPGATIEWLVEAIDSDGNRASAPAAGPEGARFFSFRVLP